MTELPADFIAAGAPHPASVDVHAAHWDTADLAGRSSLPTTDGQPKIIHELIRHKNSALETLYRPDVTVPLAAGGRTEATHVGCPSNEASVAGHQLGTRYRWMQYLQFLDNASLYIRSELKTRLKTKKFEKSGLTYQTAEAALLQEQL